MQKFVYFLPSAVVTTFHFVKSCDRFKGAAKVAGPRFQNSSSFFFFMFVLFFFFFKFWILCFFFHFPFLIKKLYKSKQKTVTEKYLNIAFSSFLFMLLLAAAKTNKLRHPGKYFSGTAFLRERKN